MQALKFMRRRTMYDQFALDYDRFVNWQNRLSFEMPFIEKFIQGAASQAGETIRVLDAACGTGMHAIALSKAGYAVSGADLSAEMIERARSNAQGANVKIRFEAAGFGALAGKFDKTQFDAIICLGNSLPHLLTAAGLLRTLRDFSDVLRPGGTLLIQNRNFDEIMLHKNRWMEPQAHQESNRQWVFERFYDFNLDGTICFNIVSLSKSVDDPWSASVHSTTLRPQLQEEMISALNQAGFTGIQTFGSLSEEPFDPLSSGNLVLTARKA
jgi:glycine/sarcosine N-methyltransferase